VTAFAGSAPAARGGVVAQVLKAEPETRLSPAQALEQLPWSQPSPKAQAAEKRAEAKAKGYEGEACGECGNFTLVRNGTCMKCDTCGSTTGCS
jgi:ribonucleoside-diphosphate reductase alpha chain